MKKRTSKLLSLLLTLTMVLGMLPAMSQVAYAAGITDASNVNVNNHSFYDPGRLYYTNGASDTGNLADNPNWNAHYDPATGVLELKNYNGGEIYTGGLKATDLTIKLTGNNTVTATGQMGVSHVYGGNIIITSDSSGSLTINISSSTTDVNGISAGYGSSFTTGNVTISGNANVTVNATATSTDYGKWANGIYAKERVSILGNASYTAVCKSATQSSGAQAGSGIFATKGVTFDTSGTVNIDASQAGVSGQGIFSGGGTNQATKVSSMTIKYKKDGSNGVPIYPQYMFDSVADNYAININDTDCVATYRYGTPYTVIVSRGKCDACGKNTGQYLANDTVTITANTLSSGLTFKKWTSSDVAFANANSITTTFTMPSKDVNVSADYNAFTVQPSFTATDTEKGDITFTLAAETTEAPKLVTKDGDDSDVVGYQYFYGSGTSRTQTIYNGTGTYQVPAGEYRVAARFDGHWFFSDPFEVSYTPSAKTLDSIAITTPPTKTTYTAGESFDTAGMVVTATYNDSSTAEVTSYTVSPSGALATSDTSVTISYTEGGVTKTAAQAITVNAASTPTAPTITTPTLPNGKVGTAYEQIIAATGDTPITWTIESGNLPDGLTLGSDGEISGTPTTPGDYTFTVKATNAAGDATQSYTVTIAPADAVTYTVSFAANGGTGAMADVTGISGDYVLPVCGFTAPNGKQFKAWSVGGVEKAVGSTINVTANTTVTAIWEAIEYNVTVTGGTASVGAGTPITKATMGTTVTLTAGAAPSGQMFDKWVVNGVVVADANSATTTFVMPAGNVTAEATYKNIPVVTYTVSFDANGGTGSMADATGVSGDYVLPVCSFTAPNGKQFKAWSVGGVEKAAGDTITVNANTTVTAIWENIPVTYYTVTFDSNGGSAVTAQSIEAGQKATKPADPTKDGFDFKGWTLNGSAYDFNTAVNGNITLVATWEQQQVVPTTYTVTVNGSYASTTGAGEYAVGETVNISAGSRSNYSFNGWTSDDVTIANASSKNASFVMPEKNVTVTAQWKYTGGGVVIPTVFPVTVKESDNGEVEASAKYAVPGSTVKLTVTPDESYELDTLTVKSGSKFIDVTEKNGKYQFVMPFGSVTVTATFKKIETPVVPDPVVPSFDDVAEDTYYFDAVEWAVENGITTGTSDTTFSPDMTCTRAQAVTFLWRAAGSPEPKSNVMPFEDVAAEAYYYKAVLWAVENGITKGTSETTFSPDADCTRAQIVTFLWRAQKSPAADSVNPFTDVAADAYYVDAVLWAVEEKVTNGTSATTFSPDADCTRAQIVTFLYRALNEQ